NDGDRRRDRMGRRAGKTRNTRKITEYAEKLAEIWGQKKRIKRRTPLEKMPFSIFSAPIFLPVLWPFHFFSSARTTEIFPPGMSRRCSQVLYISLTTRMV